MRIVTTVDAAVNFNMLQWDTMDQGAVSASNLLGRLVLTRVRRLLSWTVNSLLTAPAKHLLALRFLRSCPANPCLLFPVKASSCAST